MLKQTTFLNHVHSASLDLSKHTKMSAYMYKIIYGLPWHASVHNDEGKSLKPILDKVAQSWGY